MCQLIYPHKTQGYTVKCRNPTHRHGLCETHLMILPEGKTTLKGKPHPFHPAISHYWGKTPDGFLLCSRCNALVKNQGDLAFRAEENCYGAARRGSHFRPQPTQANLCTQNNGHFRATNIKTLTLHNGTLTLIFTDGSKLTKPTQEIP